MNNQKIKIACLHGYGTNAKFMQRQMRSFTKALQKNIQFIMIEGNIVAPQAFILDQKVIKLINGEPKSWTKMISYHHSHSQYVQSMLQNIRQAMESQSDQYDGILGFSQGATVIHSILKFMQSGKIAWKCLQKIKFAIMVCPTYWAWQQISSNQLQIPSIHLISKADFLFRKSLFTTVQFKNPQVIYHPFGHSFPRLGKLQIEQIRQFIKRSTASDSKYLNIVNYSKL